MGQKIASVRPAPTEVTTSGAIARAASPFVELLAARLAGLCEATGLDAENRAVADRIFRELIVPWSRVEAFAREPRGGGWVSDISDDNTPIEFSVTLSPVGNEVRVLFEPQSETPTLAAHRESALAMHKQLELQYGADLSRFRLVEELFTPPDMQGVFALWSAVVFSNHRPPSFKAYFNPQAQGVGSAVGLVEEGLRRLGIKNAWQHLASTLARRGPHRDELKYFALDLSKSAQARVKVYARHHEATPEDLEIAATSAPSSAPGEAEEFARAMAGGARRFTERATFTCAAFAGDADDRPSATTEYVPVCAYARDDQEVVTRVSEYLLSHDMEDATYRGVIAAFANRPLDSGVGMQSWVAFRRYEGAPRLTVYLGSETRRVFPVGSVPAATYDHMHFEDAGDVLRCVARYGLEEHPIVRDSVRLAKRRDLLWLLVSNASELLANTMDVSASRLNVWLSDNAELGRTLPAELDELRHVLKSALQAFRESASPLEALAADAVASNASRGLAKLLCELLQTEELSSVGFTLESILRDGPETDARRLSELEAAGKQGLPAIVKGALGVHQRLWAALDRIARPVAD